MIKKVLLICIAVVIALTSCSFSGVAGRSEYNIVLITKSNRSNFWNTCIAGAKAAEVEYGNVRLTVKSPYRESDYDKQNEYLRQAIEERADAVIFSACDYRKSTAYVEEALDAGIPVIVIDSDISSERDLSFIGTDNYQAGRIAAQTVAEALEGSGTIGVISFEENSANSGQRVQGFEDYIKGVEGIEILEIRYSESDYDTAQNIANEMIHTYGSQLDAIATFNELTTIGVGRAVAEAGDHNKIYVAGFDNHTESIQKLEEGYLDCLIVQNPFAMGYLGVQQVLEELGGSADKGDFDTGTAIVTKGNMYDPEIEKLLFPFSNV